MKFTVEAILTGKIVGIVALSVLTSDYCNRMR